MKESRHIYSGLSGCLLDPLWNEIRQVKIRIKISPVILDMYAY